MGRRTFLGALAVGAASGAAVVAGLLEPSTETSAAAVTAAAASNTDGVVAIGRAYLRGHAAEADVGFLTAQLPGAGAGTSVRKLLPDLTGQVADDFAAGRIVSVQGWQLALTEARASAAIALGA